MARAVIALGSISGDQSVWEPAAAATGTATGTAAAAVPPVPPVPAAAVRAERPKTFPFCSTTTRVSAAGHAFLPFLAAAAAAAAATAATIPSPAAAAASTATAAAATTAGTTRGRNVITESVRAPATAAVAFGNWRRRWSRHRRARDSHIPTAATTTAAAPAATITTAAPAAVSWTTPSEPITTTSPWSELELKQREDKRANFLYPCN